MTITAPDAPTLPSLNDPANFNTRALALFSWLVSEYIPWLETLAGVTDDGEINGTPIGQTTPAAGKFTTLTADSLSGSAVQSSISDDTSGRLTKVGAFGIGYKGGSTFTDSDLNPADPTTEASRIVTATSSTTNKPSSRVAWTGLRAKGNNTDQIVDLLVSYEFGKSPRMAIRHNNNNADAFTSWYEVITDEGGQTINGDLTASGKLDVTGGAISATGGQVVCDRSGDAFPAYLSARADSGSAAQLRFYDNPGGSYRDTFGVASSGDLQLGNNSWPNQEMVGSWILSNGSLFLDYATNNVTSRVTNDHGSFSSQIGRASCRERVYAPV